jgi:hypothetical protein
VGSSRNEPVEFEVTNVLAATDLALLCVIEGQEVWLPRSQLQDGTEVEDRGDSGTVVLPEWLAVEKGLVCHGCQDPA